MFGGILVCPTDISQPDLNLIDVVLELTEQGGAQKDRTNCETHYINSLLSSGVKNWLKISKICYFV